MKHYQQLRKEERFYIWQALREGKSQKEVAIALDRDPSTICREIKRNRYPSVVSDAIIRMLRPIKDRVKILTFDNGSEFVKHEKITKALDAKAYFANPYCSW